jgi:hypothetical protein
MPGQSPAPGANPCEAFVPLRADAEKNAAAIRTASERQAQREEICTLFQRFAASEAKVVKFLETNQKQCGIPPDVIKQSKASHAKTIQIRTQVCRAGPAPAAPSLSDALGGPGTLDTSAPPRRGVGTFDTLTGSPLVR